MTAGYSGTPLIKKLGIKTGDTVLIVNQPDHFFDLLGTLPDVSLIALNNKSSCDYIQLFAPNYAFFIEHFKLLKKRMKFSGMFWSKRLAIIPRDRSPSYFLSRSKTNKLLFVSS